MGQNGAADPGAWILAPVLAVVSFLQPDGRSYGAEWPPSTTMAEPVVQREASLAR